MGLFLCAIGFPQVSGELELVIHVCEWGTWLDPIGNFCRIPLLLHVCGPERLFLWMGGLLGGCKWTSSLPQGSLPTEHFDMEGGGRLVSSTIAKINRTFLRGKLNAFISLLVIDFLPSAYFFGAGVVGSLELSDTLLHFSLGCNAHGEGSFGN